MLTAQTRLRGPALIRYSDARRDIFVAEVSIGVTFPDDLRTQAGP